METPGGNGGSWSSAISNGTVGQMSEGASERGEGKGGGGNLHDTARTGAGCVQADRVSSNARKVR